MCRSARADGRFRAERGIRQGDAISSKLFTTFLEYMFENIRLESRGININSENLELQFADDIVLISHSLDEADSMLPLLISASHKVGLKINTFKTQFMTNLVPSRNVLVEEKEIFQVIFYK